MGEWQEGTKGKGSAISNAATTTNCCEQNLFEGTSGH